MARLEFWPDYGPGPLWTEEGKPANLQLLGLPAELIERIRQWNLQYDDIKLPLEGSGDRQWIKEGTALLTDIRSSLSQDVNIAVTEPWWGEAPC